MPQRLYYDDATHLVFPAEVTDIREVSRADGQSVWQVALDRSAFYPASGGQPHDTGVLVATAKSGATLEAPIIDVVEDEAGEVWHSTLKPLLAGTQVEGRIDAARRRDHMQQHSGQHLLSAAFIRECAAKTVSFHLGADTSTIDLAIDKLTGEQILSVERLANEIIAENRPVSLRTVDAEEAKQLLASGALRKLPERDGPIRMVEIADFDLNACGGTHVRATGEIGGLLLRKVEKAGKGIRVEFVCGLRAIDAARRDFASLSEASTLLSTAAPQLPEAVRRQLAEIKSIEKKNEALLEEVARFTAAEMLSAVVAERTEPESAERPEPTALRMIARTFADRDLAFLKLLARNFMKAAPDAVVLLASTQAEPASVLLSRGASAAPHCGNLLREQLAAMGARGGGAADMAQGAIPQASLEELLARLRSALGSWNESRPA